MPSAPKPYQSSGSEHEISRLYPVHWHPTRAAQVRSPVAVPCSTYTPPSTALHIHPQVFCPAVHVLSTFSPVCYSRIVRLRHALLGSMRQTASAQYRPYFFASPEGKARLITIREHVCLPTHTVVPFTCVCMCAGPCVPPITTNASWLSSTTSIQEWPLAHECPHTPSPIEARCLLQPASAGRLSSPLCLCTFQAASSHSIG